jgi:hypothetical protein
MSRPVTPALLVAVWLLAAACGSDPASNDGPGAPSPAGPSGIVVSVEGKGFGPQGSYAIVLDGERTLRTITANARTSVAAAPGTHELSLADVPPYCVVAEPSVRVDVPSVGTASFRFTATCTGGTFQVTTAGVAVDNDGYTFTLDDNAPAGLSGNGEQLIALAAGPHRLRVDGVAPNCTVADNPRTIDVAPAAANVIPVQVTCVGGALRAQVTTTGFDVPDDGYALVVTGAGGELFGRYAYSSDSDSQLVGAWPAGTQVTTAIEGLAPNCRADAPSRVSTMRTPDTLSVRFAVSCELLASQIVMTVQDTGTTFRTGIYRLVDGTNTLVRAGAGVDAEWADGHNTFAFAAPSGIRLVDEGLPLGTTANGLNPAFTPDGRRVLFMARYVCPFGCNYPSSIQQVDLDQPAALPRTVFSTPGEGIAAFDLSADGRQLALLFGSDFYVQFGLGIGDPTTGQARRIPTGDLSLQSSRPRFSPDGREVLVQARCGSPTGSCGWVVPLDGSPARRVSDELALAWSPDGNRLLIASPSSNSTRLFSVRASDGLDPRDLATTPGRVLSADWRP